MDRSWLNADRRSTEYILGVEEFIAFALTNSRDPRNICCPCTRCGNDGSFSARVVRDHLFVNGIDTSYTVWTDHGEAAKLGTQYTTKERDDMRSKQNSSVYLVAETPQVASARDKRMVREDMSFYGVIIEIWELNYEKFRFPIFKFDWVDNGKGAVVVDELGFTLVNLSKKGHFNDTFILGSCVEKIFYVTDPVDSQ
ncbi:hypothetical protein OROHE_014320 [Orobanche hederae]